MKILHTADWHIGQTFHEYDRSYEHQQFLNWLVSTIRKHQIDVLLISGDIFDLSNPAASSVKMFYTFLKDSLIENPDLQIIITAGNHDSASRLESPKPLLSSSNIHIVGIVEKTKEGLIDYEKLVVPIKDKSGKVKIWCMAVPFLRMGDYPAVPNASNPYAEGVATLYEELYKHVANKKQVGESIICMGHLHTQQAEISDLDKSERLIMGGVECISASAFNDGIKYVALGHIHKAQKIGGKEHIRYSGSPIPLSFSELNYKHQVIAFELEDEKITQIETIEVPLSIDLLRVPTKNSKFSDVLSALDQLPPCDDNHAIAPYLEVRVLLDAPEPGLRHKIETALIGKNVRLAKIDVKYPVSEKGENTETYNGEDKLQVLKPIEVFSKIYQSKFKNTVPESIQLLFNQIAEEVAQTDKA